MKNKNSLNGHLILVLLLGMTLACTNWGDAASCSVNPLLKPLLNAKNEKAFNELLLQHGPVKREELPCIMAATKSWSEAKQIRAAQLLVILHGDEVVIFEAQMEVLSETKNVVVWAMIMESLLYLKNPNVADLAGKRPELITKALNYTNRSEKRLEGRVQSTGLKAGVMAKIPGIEDELKKRLDSDVVDLVTVALDAIPTKMSRDETPRFLKMLEDYEGGKTYTGFRNSVFAALLTALIRSEDEKAFAAAKHALEIGLTNSRLVRGSREELQDFRNKIVFVPGEDVQKFCLYLIRENGTSKPFAFDILSTRITRKIQEPTVAVVKECVELIEKGNLSTDYRLRIDSALENTGQVDCERLFHFLETGENTTGKVKFGSDALPIGKKWLREH